MWSGGISKRNPVRHAGKWARGLTCQTAKTPACHIQIVMQSIFCFYPQNPFFLHSPSSGYELNQPFLGAIMLEHINLAAFLSLA